MKNIQIHIQMSIYIDKSMLISVSVQSTTSTHSSWFSIPSLRTTLTSISSVSIGVGVDAHRHRGTCMGAASTSSSVATSSSFAAFQIHKKKCFSFLHDWNHPSLPPPPLLPPQPPPPPPCPPRPPPPAPAFCQHSGCPGLDKTLVYGSALALAFFLISSFVLPPELWIDWKKISRIFQRLEVKPACPSQ